MSSLLEKLAQPKAPASKSRSTSRPVELPDFKAQTARLQALLKAKKDLEQEEKELKSALRQPMLDAAVAMHTKCIHANGQLKYVVKPPHYTWSLQETHVEPLKAVLGERFPVYFKREYAVKGLDLARLSDAAIAEINAAGGQISAAERPTAALHEARLADADLLMLLPDVGLTIDAVAVPFIHQMEAL